jgi:salicylate hydroxylase
MEITVFGAGIAGLMAAITLRAEGHRCRVYERNPRAHESGMGFILMPEGIACLTSFGIRLDGALGGRPLGRYRCRDASGRVLYEVAMPAGARGIRRRDLVAALTQAWLSDGAIAFAAGIESFELDGAGRITSARVSTAAGEERVEADLYVGAEGIHSRAREALFPGWPIKPHRVPELVGFVGGDGPLRWAGDDFNKLHALEGGVALGILPVDARHLIWYLQFDAQRFPLPEIANVNDAAGAEARRAFAAKLLGAFGDPVPALLAATDFSRVYSFRPSDADLIPSFHRENLVLVGDAAHPLSPFTSQGVSSAVADAVALAREVGPGTKSTEPIAAALARYSEERRAQCAPYIAKGRSLTENFVVPLNLNNLVLPVA